MNIYFQILGLNATITEEIPKESECVQNTMRED